MLTLPRHLSFFFPPSKLLWPMHACYTTPFTHTPLPHSHQSFFSRNKRQSSISHLLTLLLLLLPLFLNPYFFHRKHSTCESHVTKVSSPKDQYQDMPHTFLVIKKKLINKHEKKLMETTLSLSLYFFAPLKASHHNFFLFNSQGCFGTQHSSFLALSPAAFAPIHTGA